MTEQQGGSSAQTAEDLRGQVALITGASSGIGAAVAEALARRGVRVALAARRAERLRELAERLASTPGGETLTIQCDVRDPDAVQQMVRATLDLWGRLDVLVANAGLGYRSPVVLKYGVPPLLERRRGHVIVTSSVAGRVATPGGAAYCGTKFAATAIAESLRQEVGPQGVRVTTIEPGVVLSEFQAVAGYTPETLAGMLKGAEPLVPADIARAVVFAIEQPAHYAVNEIVVRATGQAYP